MLLDGMERRSFESGNPTPGGSQEFLVSLPAGFALYGLELLQLRSTSEDSGQGPTTLDP